MKIKVGDKDADKAFVVCNGEPVKYAVEADEELGYVDYFVNIDNRARHAAELKIHRVFGHVVIGFFA